MQQPPENIIDILERISDAFIAVDKNWQFTYVNKQAGQITGKEPASLIGKKIWKEFPEAVSTLFYEAFDRTMQEQKYAYASGYYSPLQRWLEVHVYPSADGISVFIRDITERTNAEENLLKANRLFYFVSHVTQMIVKAVDEETIFREVCQIAVDIGKFRMAWVGIIDEKTSNVIPVAFAGHEDGYLSSIKKISVADVPEGRGPTGVALREGKYVFCNNIEKDPNMVTWREEALHRGYYSSISFPIKKFGRVIGAFTMYASTINYFNKEEIALLEETNSDISFAIEVLEKEVLRRKAEEALLLKTNELNERVKELDCLYRISELCNSDDFSIKDILRQCVDIIPSAYKYPEITCIRISFREDIFYSDRFKETGWLQQAEIYIQGELAGQIEIFYVEEKPEEQEGPFLQEERWMINSIAKLISATAERKKGREEILEMNKQLRMLSGHLQKIREEERTSVAREIHDELRQQLTVLKMDVSWLQKKLGDSDETIRQKTNELKQMLDETVKTVRRISSELRPSMLDDMGLEAAIDWQLSEFARRFHLKTGFENDSVEHLLSDDMKTGLFRIVQESLTNVGRYANAGSVSVSLKQQNGQLVLVIRDDGIGFDKDIAGQKKTLGILGMKERAGMLGGTYNISSVQGQGTTVTVKIPLEK